jgi:succinate dehydrogenase / fumarate reductase, cytochrome b subunit
MKDVREALFVGTTTDGRTVRRPLSPHLQVYKPQITSMLSIFHRISGVALAVGVVVLVWWLVAAATSEAAFAVVSAVLHTWVGHLALFGWTAALWFHFCAGIRHLVWDSGHGLELPEVHTTGAAVIGLTGLLTVLTWLVGIIVV